MTLHTQFLRWSDVDADFAARWLALVDAGRFNLSLSHGWMDKVARSRRTAEAQVAALYEGDDLIGVLPFRCHRTSFYGIGLNAVDLCSNLVSYHAEVPALKAHDRLLLDTLAHAHGGKWDVFHAGNIDDDTATARALAALTAQVRGTMLSDAGETSPYIRIESSWDEFLKTRNQKFRANLSRTQRRTDVNGAARVLWYKQGSDTAQLLDFMLQVERQSWKADAGIAISGSAQETQYYAELLPYLAAIDALFANVLMIEDRPAAYVLCAHRGGWMGQLKTSFVASIADCGARAIDESVKAAFAANVREYDFLGEATPHKLKWTSLTRTHRHHWLFAPRLKAAAVAFAKRAARRMQERLARRKSEDQRGE